MIKYKKYIIGSGIAGISLVLFALFGHFSPVSAAACSFNISGSASVSTSCSIDAGTINGVDAGVTAATNSAQLTITNASITISQGSVSNITTLIAGKLVIGTGGSILLPDPSGTKYAKVYFGHIYYIDQDGDGYPSTTTAYTDPGTNRVARSTLTSISTTDCDDTNGSLNTSCCTAGGGACTADGDCCSPNVCGTDEDSDNYFSLAVGHSGTCQATHPYTDCFDDLSTYPRAALVYPSAAPYYTVQRGDGSFDYNCDDTYGGGTHGDCSCSSCGTHGNIASCPEVNDPSCGSYYTHGSVDESHQGGLCYDNTACFVSTIGVTVSCR